MQYDGITNDTVYKEYMCQILQEWSQPIASCAVLHKATLKHYCWSLSNLGYPNGTKTVWLYDASVPFLHGKRIPLFIASLFFFTLFLPYTLLLLQGQWLQANSHLKILSWARIRNSRLKSDSLFKCLPCTIQV